jgi:ketosteroid isomerase-like protein
MVMVPGGDRVRFANQFQLSRRKRGDVMRQLRVQVGRTMVGVVSLVILAAFPAAAATNLRQAIEAANKKFEAAVSRGDGPGTAALYTAAGQLLPAQSDVVSGTLAIGQFWQGVYSSGIKGATLTTLEVENHGNTAHEVGKYELRGADGKVLDHGKYIVIWKKEGASWKLHRDIWTTSVAPAKP